MGDIYKENTLNIDDIRIVTRKIADQGGWDQFMPTLISPLNQKVFVLDGVPDDVDHGVAALEWALEKADKKNYLCMS